jgi:hypothetical protein
VTEQAKTYGQILREKGIGLGRDAVPSRTRQVARRRREHYNGWERGVARDERGMPYLDESGREIGMKKFTEEYRGKFAERDQMRASEHLSQE